MWNLNLHTQIRNFINSPNFFGGRYTIEDNTEVVVYTDQPDIFAGYTPRRALKGAGNNRDIKVSFIATAFNEYKTVEMLLSGIFNQTRLPDEILIADTGSSDGTLEKLEQFAMESPVSFDILVLPEGNIAQGRNLAISNARFPIIAVSDFGCNLPKDWLENLITPFEDDPEIQVSFGRYEAVGIDNEPTKWVLNQDLGNFMPQSHLPSAVSIAFQKQVWEMVGGYPEWLSMTGEDTYFALELKRTTMHWAFVPEAEVMWIAPQTISSYLRKSFLWSSGDGEAGTTAQSYRWALLKIAILFCALLVLFLAMTLVFLADSLLVKIISGGLLLTLAAYALVYIKKRRSSIKDEFLLAAVYSSEVLGFLYGLSQRPQVDQRRLANIHGAIFILAGVPIDDTGGGARWTQLALEFLRRQYLVFFIHKFPKYESKDLHLEYKHPNLITKVIHDVNWSVIFETYRPALVGKPVMGLIELPLKDYLPTIKHLHSINGVVVYDLLDAWETSLGGEWYNPEIEGQIIKESDLIFATVVGLSENLALRTEKSVYLVPNAVNSYLFNPERNFPLPKDYPPADWHIIYIGALWGEWFDWDLLKKIAVHYPDANILVIGDTLGLKTELPGNVHFLGLIPQRDLPAYLHYSQVAILPWKVNSITQMTSPLKVYEYIAMHKPVVAPMLEPLKGIPGVFQVQDELDFVKMVGDLRDYHPPKQEIVQFINQNNWEARVDQILRLTDNARDDNKDQE